MKNVQIKKKRTLKMTAGNLTKLNEFMETLFQIKNTELSLDLITFFDKLNEQISVRQQEINKKKTDYEKENADKLQDFENKRVEILEKFALKNEAGEFLFKVGNDGSNYYDFSKEGLEQYNKAFAELTEEYKELITGLQAIGLATVEEVFEAEVFLYDYEYYIKNIKNLSAVEIGKLKDFYNFLTK